MFCKFEFRSSKPQVTDWHDGREACKAEPKHTLRTSNLELRTCPSLRTSSAFSLIEIMVVLVIIGLLAGVVTLNVRHSLVSAKQHTARMEIATLVDALEMYYTTYGKYPSNDQGLDVLTKPSEKIDEALVQQMPIDPWGNPYQYNQPGRSGPFEVICFGADGRDGGDGADKDITNESLKEQ